MITQIATLTLNDMDKLGFLIRQLKELQTHTRKELGCEVFTFYQDKETLGTFVLFEQFKDKASLDAHLELPHTKTFFSHNLISVSQIKSLIELS